MSRGAGAREMVCIACPIGCRLSVERAEGDAVSVAGNRCPKGEVYAREELLAPRRTVTAVVRTGSAPSRQRKSRRSWSAIFPPWGSGSCCRGS